MCDLASGWEHGLLLLVLLHDLVSISFGNSLRSVGTPPHGAVVVLNLQSPFVFLQFHHLFYQFKLFFHFLGLAL